VEEMKEESLNEKELEMQLPDIVVDLDPKQSATND
jgi:hypothetical protein